MKIRFLLVFFFCFTNVVWDVHARYPKNHARSIRSRRASPPHHTFKKKPVKKARSASHKNLKNRKIAVRKTQGRKQQGAKWNGKAAPSLLNPETVKKIENEVLIALEKIQNPSNTTQKSGNEDPEIKINKTEMKKEIDNNGEESGIENANTDTNGTDTDNKKIKNDEPDNKKEKKDDDDKEKNDKAANNDKSDENDKKNDDKKEKNDKAANNDKSDENDKKNDDKKEKNKKSDKKNASILENIMNDVLNHKKKYAFLFGSSFFFMYLLSAGRLQKLIAAFENGSTWSDSFGKLSQQALIEVSLALKNSLLLSKSTAQSVFDFSVSSAKDASSWTFHNIISPPFIKIGENFTKYRNWQDELRKDSNGKENTFFQNHICSLSLWFSEKFTQDVFEGYCTQVKKTWETKKNEN